MKGRQLFQYFIFIGSFQKLFVQFLSLFGFLFPVMKNVFAHVPAK